MQYFFFPDSFPKYACSKHSEKPITNDLYKRDKAGKIKRNIFRRESNFTIFEIGTCCLLAHDFSSLKNSCFYSENIDQIWYTFFKNFMQEKYTRICFDHFIHGPMIENFCYKANVSNSPNNRIVKYDINRKLSE